MAFPSVTYTITNGQPNDGSQVAQNFTDLVNALSDGTKSLNIAAFACTTIAASAAITAAAALTVGTTLGVTGAATLSSTLAVTGAATLSSTLAVTGASTLTGTVTIGGGSVLTRATTSPSVNRLVVGELLQVQGSTGPILSNAGGGRTLGVLDATTGTSRPAVVSATPSTHGLMIVAGTVSSTGTLVSGEGFTPARNSIGNYTITFSTAFATTPVVIPGANNTANPYFPQEVTAISTSAFTLQCSDLGGVSRDTQWSFIAIGQRGA